MEACLCVRIEEIDHAVASAPDIGHSKITTECEIIVEPVDAGGMFWGVPTCMSCFTLKQQEDSND